MDASLYLIQLATSDFLKMLKDRGEEFHGDSIDREQVRDILISNYGLVFPDNSK